MYLIKQILKKFFLLTLIFFIYHKEIYTKPPKLIIVFILDQGAEHYFKKLSPYFTHSFHNFIRHGISFENAYHPHGAPTTATGHATISTGACAKVHGVVLNSWLDKKNKKIIFGRDSNPKTDLLAPHKQTRGYSSRYLMAETISDKLMQNITRDKKHIAIALSLKARAAIALAGKQGKAIWFDTPSETFTSSKAYFQDIPQWVKKFNLNKHLSPKQKTVWELRFRSKSNSAYKFNNICDYSFASAKNFSVSRNTHSLIDVPISIKSSKSYSDDNENKDPEWVKTPFANKLLLDLGKRCIDYYLYKLNKGTLLLWISLSSLDKIGHLYGPDSLECIDMLYHLDRQIEHFITYTCDQVGSKNALFILTADHGVTPIPELLNKEGFTNANRILSTRLITQMNTLIKQKFGIKKIIKSFKTNQFFLNKKALSFVNHKTQQDIISSLKDYLSSQQGITACWTPNELASLVCNSTDFEQYFKNQLYPSRSGDLVCMPELNCMLIKYPTGTAHRTPYDPDTHVPLFFYQKGTYENKIITTRVYMTQLAPTLAKILGIPCPNGSSSQLLPEI